MRDNWEDYENAFEHDTEFWLTPEELKTKKQLRGMLEYYAENRHLPEVREMTVMRLLNLALMAHGFQTMINKKRV